MELEDGLTRPAAVTHLRDSEKYSFLEMTITEGRNRQVRRMLEAVESKVLKLVRTAIGPIRIGELQMGNWRDAHGGGSPRTARAGGGQGRGGTAAGAERLVGVPAQADEQAATEPR